MQVLAVGGLGPRPALRRHPRGARRQQGGLQGGAHEGAHRGRGGAARSDGGPRPGAAPGRGRGVLREEHVGEEHPAVHGQGPQRRPGFRGEDAAAKLPGNRGPLGPHLDEKGLEVAQDAARRTRPRIGGASVGRLAGIDDGGLCALRAPLGRAVALRRAPGARRGPGRERRRARSLLWEFVLRELEVRALNDHVEPYRLRPTALMNRIVAAPRLHPGCAALGGGDQRGRWGI
mmetsp:Transcript_88363/g.245985  ORF Transcript_88363/g.245985 Transcript_88363/m.245985 type:complete len:232 (-) Transcript_88363:86-781(-)